MDAPVELYNIDRDPGESKELSQQYPDIHEEFVAIFEQHKG